MLEREPGFRTVRLGEIGAEHRIDAAGIVHVRSTQALGSYATSVPHAIAQWAQSTPDAIMVADRAPDGSWRTLTYSQVMSRIAPLAQALLDAGLSPGRPLVILSGNEIEHVLLGLGRHLGRHSLCARLAGLFAGLHRFRQAQAHRRRCLQPGMVYASDGKAFGARHRRRLCQPTCRWSCGSNPPQDRDCPASSRSLGDDPGDRRRRSAPIAAVTADTIAKLLFTSGSTGMPKG